MNNVLKNTRKGNTLAFVSQTVRVEGTYVSRGNGQVVLEVDGEQQALVIADGVFYRKLSDAPAAETTKLEGTTKIQLVTDMMRDLGNPKDLVRKNVLPAIMDITGFNKHGANTYFYMAKTNLVADQAKVVVVE